MVKMGYPWGEIPPKRGHTHRIRREIGVKQTATIQIKSAPPPSGRVGNPDPRTEKLRITTNHEHPQIQPTSGQIKN